jgi:hypothetical protein
LLEILAKNGEMLCFGKNGEIKIPKFEIKLGTPTLTSAVLLLCVVCCVLCFIYKV